MRPSVKTRAAFVRCSCNSSTPPDVMLVSYLVSTMLLVWKSEFMVLVANELGDLWVSDLKLVLLYPCCNNLLDLMDCIM